MSKIAIYTSLVGGYDNLLQPEVVDENFDYICFSFLSDRDMRL